MEDAIVTDLERRLKRIDDLEREFQKDIEGFGWMMCAGYVAALIFAVVVMIFFGP